MRASLVATGAAVLVPVIGTAQAAHALSRPAAPQLLTTAEIAAKATAATVTILTFDATGDTLSRGNGFVVRSDGVIVTNWHVIRGAQRAVVILADHELYQRVSFVDSDSNVDVGVLRISGDSLPVLETSSAIPAVGSHVVTVGSAVGEGTVAASRVVAGRQLVQLSPGSSGGAVLDAAGRMFAITTSANVAVPVRYAVDLLTAATGTKPVVGTYKAIETIRDAANTPRALLLGYLVAGTHVGWLSQWWQNDDSTRDPIAVYNVATFHTRTADSVALDVGGQAYDGVQTDEGFALRSSVMIADTTRTLDLRGFRFEVPRSETLGLYSVTCRTTYYTGSTPAGLVDWAGELAAAVDDSSNVYLDLWMQNGRGGTTAATGRTHLETDGRFELVVNRDGHSAHLAGAIQAGVLRAQWQDNRDNGRFEGALEAERQ